VKRHGGTPTARTAGSRLSACGLDLTAFTASGLIP
jgi:hypothetical protein